MTGEKSGISVTREAPAAPLRVLIADDDKAARALLRLLLELVDGVDIVGEAHDGLEVVRLAQDTRPQLVILDVRMPRLDGMSAAEALLAADPAIQLIVHTSEPETSRLRHAERLGIRISDKADPEGLIRQVEEAAAAALAAPSVFNRLHAAVLAALLGSIQGQGLIVATRDSGIVFYSRYAADLMGWAFPPGPLPLEAWLEDVALYDTAGELIPAAERPMSRSLEGKVWQERAVVLESEEVRVPLVLRATPLLGPDRELVGAATYFRVTPDGEAEGNLLLALERRLRAAKS